MRQYDFIVIGAGLAGLTAACWLARAGRRTLLVAKGIGALLLSSAAIDVLGFHPAESPKPVTRPLEQLDTFCAERPEHPYCLLGVERIRAGLEAFLALANGDAGLDYRGSTDRNWLLPSPVGAVHPTCLAPDSLARGELSEGGRLLVVGFRELRDFYPGLISQNLNAQVLGVESSSLVIDLPAPAAGKMNITPIELARALENADFRRRLAGVIVKESRGCDRVALPAVLGLERHAEVMSDLQRGLDKPVFEISTLPPSVPGRRLFDAFKRTFLAAGGTLIVGAEVLDGTIEDGRVTHIRLATVNRRQAVRAERYILATGGTYGGGIQTDASGRVWDPIFGLPVRAPSDRRQWFATRFLHSAGQPIGFAGIQVDRRLNPVASDGARLADNLYVAGATLAGSNWISGRTGNGLAVTTAAAIVAED